MELCEKKKKMRKKPISAMDQVGGKVNSGIMGAITCGGMFEGAEPESDTYSIGFKSGETAFSDYAHVNESNGKKHKIIKNDEGQIVPDKCPKCGSDVKIYIKGEPVYLCSNEKCGEYFGTVPCNINEISEKDVDLSSFEIKHNLNPKFWVDGHLDSRIRMKLLDIADDFVDFLSVDWVDPKDIIMTGSLANYNWSKKYSDIDLHILINFKEVDENIDLVKEYFDAKKNLWNESHSDIKIFGFPVELYVQDVKEKHSSSGVYSIEKDKWIDEPDYEALSSFKNDPQKIKKSVAEYVNKIDSLYEEFDESGMDMHKIEVVNKKASDLFDDIKKERKDGFEKSPNEMGTQNIIFKCLRRMDYITKLIDLRTKTYDILNSIVKESIKLNNKKKTIYLTEAQINSIYSNENLLDEISIQDKYQKEKSLGKTSLDLDTYTRICLLDPTSKNGQAGKYANWLLQHVSEETGQTNDLRVALEQFNDGVKRNILGKYGISNDIGQFKTVESLISTMEGIMSSNDIDLSKSETDAMNKLSGEYDIIGENDEWRVVAPKTFEAERHFGGGTKWCTVGNIDYFNKYIKSGPLYILIPKKLDEKYRMQFHFESESFADVQDNVSDSPKKCIIKLLGDTYYDSLNNFCSEVFKEKYTSYPNVVKFSDAEKVVETGVVYKIARIFDSVKHLEGDIFFSVELNGLFNIIDMKKKRIVSNTWFNKVYGILNGYALVNIDNKQNLLNVADGSFFSDKWYDLMDYLRCSWVRVGIKNHQQQQEGTYLFNYINKDGDLFFKDRWFEYAEPFLSQDSKPTVFNFSKDKDNTPYTISTDGRIEKVEKIL